MAKAYEVLHVCVFDGKLTQVDWIVFGRHLSFFVGRLWHETANKLKKAKRPVTLTFEKRFGYVIC